MIPKIIKINDHINWTSNYSLQELRLFIVAGLVSRYYYLRIILEVLQSLE